MKAKLDFNKSIANDRGFTVKIVGSICTKLKNILTPKIILSVIIIADILLLTVCQQ